MNLKEHQKEVVNKFKNQKALIVFHGLGSGKTLTSIACAEEYPNIQKIVITPASLTENYKKELKKFNVKENQYKIYSYDKFADLNNEDICEDKIVILDEAHRLSDPSGSIARTILSRIKMSYKIIFLTATPFVNHPADISSIMNVIHGKKVLPTIRKEFENEYIKKNNESKKRQVGNGIFSGMMSVIFPKSKYKEITNNEIKNKTKLRELIGPYIHYYDSREANKNNYPSSNVYVEKIVMSKNQSDLHTKAMRETLDKNDYKLIKKMDEFETKTQTQQKRLNAFLSKTRQIVNYVEIDKTSPKFERIKELLNTGLRPSIVYSNFKDAGVKKLHTLLEKENIQSSIFSGSETIKKKKEMVEQYNSGKLDVLLITKSGSEGIDLKKTRQIIILEPHWNLTRINQVIGRGIRYKSHINLNKKDRNVDVYHLLSIYKPTYFKSFQNPSSDEYLYELSRKKQDLINTFIGALNI